MKNNLIIKKCMSCGAIVKVLKDCTCNNCGIKCCGEEMQILLPNSVDAAIEKHVPTYEKVEDEILVKVNHVMEKEHSHSINQHMLLIQPGALITSQISMQ